MPRNDAQQAAAQVATQRKALAKRQDGPKGLAEDVRQEQAAETTRQMGGTDNMMRSLFGGNPQRA
jgi:hypothetical protein